MIRARARRWVATVAVFAATGGLAAASPPPHRVITLAPHATEIVYAAGGGAQVVGTVTRSDYPAAAKAVPRVGDGITVNQERVILLHPTLFVGWQRSGVALQLEALSEKLGAQVIYSEPKRVRDIPADIRRIGAMLGTDAAASEAAFALEARIDHLEAMYSGKSSVPVFIEVGSMPLYTIGNDPLMNDAMRICGAVNIYGDADIPAPRVPIESVLVKNPRLIVATDDNGENVQEVRARWARYGLPAAVQGRVHAGDPDALYRPGPRFIDAVESLCAAVDAARP